MSSPAPSFGQWQTPQAQASPMPTGTECDEDGVSVRPMRLKVLYTFDDQNKTNCLARWPDVLNIQTVAMDDNTSIGVVELKTCIRAIVQCSPELVARLGQDYTVYAYDYSEYDNPLVGQGMLSWALAASSPTPTAPAHQSRQLITGRVCKNIPAIFANGIKDTLEVKLRLVPVPTVLQSEYISNMERYREISKVLPPGFDHNEWQTFLQSNPNLANLATKVAAPTPQTPSGKDGMTMEVLNQLLSTNIQQAMQNSLDQQAVESQTTNLTAKSSRPSSRASVRRPYKKRQKATAVTGGNTSGYEEGTDAEERPASRKRAKENPAAPVPEDAGTDGEEVVGRKKRAKITKADWNSKETIGSASDSLRVTASTAASVRLFRPIAMNPSNGDLGNHLQEIPRAPTPVPQLPNQRRSQDGSSQSSLRRASFLSQGEQRKHVSPYPPVASTADTEDQLMDSIESVNPSPERASHFGTPPDIGSSPPVMRSATSVCSPQCPSSPELPTMPRTDSGFMSGSLDDLFGEGEDFDEDLNPTEIEQQEAPQQVKKRRGRVAKEEEHHGFMIQEEIPGPVEFLPTRMIRNTPPPAPRPVMEVAPKPSTEPRASESGQTLSTKQENSPAPQLEAGSSLPQLSGHTTFSRPSRPNSQPTTQSRPSSRSMIRTASMGSLTLPTVAASDPALPPSNLQRSQTWSQVPHAASEAPKGPKGSTPTPTPTDASADAVFARAQSAEQAAKNNITRKRLEQAIEKGEMPPFCNNCGAIDTPTWRKAFVQELQGTPGYYDYSDAPGRVTAVEVLTRTPDGTPTSYRIVKKSLARHEDKKAFKEISLCNPCGIWISKYKVQRPEEKYIKTAMGEPAKRRRRKDPNAGAALPTSEAYLPPSEGYFPPTEAPQPQPEPSRPPVRRDGPNESVQKASTLPPIQPNREPRFQSQPETRSQPQIAPAYGMQASHERRRASSLRPPKRVKAMTSDVASAALRRAIQSSPARWVGTQDDPIEVEDVDLGSTRRILFPSPRKDGSPKVLGEVVTNVVSVATEFRSLKGAAVATADKENCPPAFEGEEDADLMKLFEEEMARPTTPVQKSPATTNPFKTPTRPASNHRPITRSVTRSGRSLKSPGQLMMMIQKTPTRTPRSVRRSPRNHPAIFESPFTATLNQLMSDANNQSFSPSRHIELDFGSLPPLDASHSNVMSFAHLPAFDSDFFSTDIPMPSSPPRLNFSLYEDGHVDPMWNIDFDGKGGTLELEGMDEDEVVLVKTEPDSAEQGINDTTNEQQQA
ncbi:hypothetical protein BP5796_00554 [Coleophoma crateriformis]|uniref:Ams2/SPT21 N-terminal domain-containing protein n=1 Tax=Coleophoma crateriformis TaxID=565419 RepID=A0A3D8T8N1_9HELO|nr:hypothetical protein BP5796_00554 [Coleophoma crateriformis]